MAKYASKVIEQAKAWLGFSEASGKHKQIIDTYNAHKPLARGYKVTYTDAWCATFVSAVSIKLGYTDIIPTECGCGEMVKLLQKIGEWVEDESRTPNPGDILFYDWQDDGKGNNTGWPDHVGIVEKVENGVITVIEGNYKDSVTRRTIAVNGKNIRGYGVPKYDKEPVAAPTVTETKADFTLEMQNLKKGSKGEDVKALQILLIGRGCSCGSYGADGDFGNGTDKAVKAYQKANGLTADGIAGKNTWGKLLGLK